MSESFYMSNMSPQAPQFNRGIWSKLEKLFRHFATKEKRIVVVTGPILPAEKTIINQLAQALKKPGKEVNELLSRQTELWDEMFPAELNRLMHLLLKKVTLYEDRLDLDIRTEGMQQLLGELDYEDHN